LKEHEGWNISVEGHAHLLGPSADQLSWESISGRYFQTMGVPLSRGRFFSDQDGPDSPRVAIINEAMARRDFPREEPIGKRFKLGDPQSRAPWLTVVGVVGDMRRQGPERQPIPQMFVPYAQVSEGTMDMVVRTASDPLSVAKAVRNEIQSIDKTVPMYDVT